MRKRAIKRYNGENDSDVKADYAHDPISKVIGESEIDRASRMDKMERGGGERGPEPIPSEESEKPAKSFKQAFAEARRSGDKSFMWQGKKYTTELAQSKTPAKETATQRTTESVQVASKPAKTTKEEMADIVSRTPLRNVQGGIHVENALRRMQEVGTAGMKESGRQARVDRIRRNVGSNLETYGMKKGGTASSRADGIATRGKTRGKVY